MKYIFTCDCILTKPEIWRKKVKKYQIIGLLLLYVCMGLWIWLGMKFNKPILVICFEKNSLNTTLVIIFNYLLILSYINLFTFWFLVLKIVKFNSPRLSNLGKYNSIFYKLHVAY